MSTQLNFSIALILSGIFVIIGLNLYTPNTGFTLQNSLGIASIIFFGGLAAFAIYKGIKQLVNTTQTV